MLENLLHGIRSGGTMLLKNLCDLINASCEVFNVCPLPKSFGPPDKVLNIIVLCEISIFQVLVIPQKERREI
jgi:hypothetical protein